MFSISWSPEHQLPPHWCFWLCHNTVLWGCLPRVPVDSMSWEWLKQCILRLFVLLQQIHYIPYGHWISSFLSSKRTRASSSLLNVVISSFMIVKNFAALISFRSNSSTNHVIGVVLALWWNVCCIFHDRHQNQNIRIRIIFILSM